MDDPEEPTDPVRARFDASEDLYDVATWDARSAVDRLAVLVHAGLRAARSRAIVALALVLFVTFFGLAVLLVAEQPVLGVLGVLSVLPALVLMGYLWIDDPTQREPLEPLAITFLLAILFATVAAVLNTAFRPLFEAVPVVGLVLFFVLVVGPVEESVKWLSIRVHAYDGPSFNTVVDGVVYGAVAGLGFAAVENLTYILDAYLMVADAGTTAQVRTAFGTAIGRALVGPGHVLFSALAGFYLGLAKFNPASRGPIVVKGLLLAALAHAAYNSIVSYVPFSDVTFVAFVVVFDGVLLVVILRKVARYETYYHALDDGDRGQSPGGSEPAEAGE